MPIGQTSLSIGLRTAASQRRKTNCNSGAGELVSSPSADDWKSRYRPIRDWDRMFAEGEWDYLDSPGEAARYALIAGYIHRRQNAGRVLDVGCGTGLLCRYLDQSRVRYSGIDLSPTAIAHARERFSQGHFQVSDMASSEPPPRQLFDALVFNEVLPHVEDPLGSLSRFFNFLRADGIVVISTFQNRNLRSNAAMFSALLDGALKQGRWIALAGCEVVTSEKGLKWRIDVIARDAGPSAGF